MAGLSAHIPIAELNPALDTQSLKSVKAIVTLTWPFSSATGSVAFLLAEPDFRLRRSKGQVRVQFSGSSAKRIAKSGIASGDEVIICLDGVEWLRDAAPTSTPGRGVDFELKFTERLLLQFTPEGSETQQVIDIDHPPTDAEEAVAPERHTTPEPSITAESNNVSSQLDRVLKNGDEWSSPAFIKRARTSYGSLFDTGYDPFAEEDGTIPGKGRKRSRLGSTWRYISRSPSPEPDEESVPATSPTPAAAPTMADGGSQTVEFDIRDTAETLAHFSRQASRMLKNAEVSALAGGDQQFDSLLPEIRTSEILPPATPTPAGFQIADAIQPVYMQEEPLPQAPSSPYLKPISSDALPLVSPLMPSTPNSFVQNEDGISQLTQTTDILHTNSLNQEPSHVEDGHRELAQRDPVDLGGENIPGFSTFHDHAIATGEVDQQGFEGQLPSNRQIGKWESVNAHPGLAAPSKDESQAEHFYADGVEEDIHGGHRFEEHLEHSFPIPPPESISYSQYPPLDNDLRDQPIDSHWTLGPRSVSYPDLPDSHQEIGHTMNNIFPSSLIGISDAKDVQSAVVDITESDVDTEERSVSEHSGAHNVREALKEEDEEVEVDEKDEQEEEEEVVGEVVGDQASERDETLRHRFYSEEEVSMDYQGVSEEYSEENENYDHYDEEEFSDENRDGEGYDEEDMDGDELQYRSPVQREPVVIDLLSSDDEDNEEMPIPSPHPAKSTREEAESELASEAKEDEDEGESEYESDVEEDDDQELDPERNIPYSQRTELPTTIKRDESKGPPDQEQHVPANDIHKHVEGDEDMDEEQHAPANKVDGHVEVDENIDEEQHAPANDIEEHIEADEDMDGDQHAPANDVERHAEVDEDMDKVVKDAEDQDKPCTEDNEEVDLARVNEDSNLKSNGPTAIHADETPSSPVQSPVKPDGALDTKTVEEPAPRQQPSLLARMFNLDGANDENAAISSFPVLPKKVPAARQTLDSKLSTQMPTDQSLNPGNTQLPTPDATQIQIVEDSQEELSLVTSTLHPMESSQQSTAEQQIGTAAESKIRSPPAEEHEQVVKSTEHGGVEPVETKPASKDTPKSEIEIGAKEYHAEQVESVTEEKRAEVFEEIEKQSSIDKPPNDLSEARVENHVEDTTRVSPRRSRRIGRLSGSAAQIAEMMRPSTLNDSPVEAKFGDEQKSPATLNRQADEESPDPSIRMAMSVLKPSPKPQHDLRSTSTVDLKLSLSRTLRTDLSEFTALKVVRFHLNQKLDVLAIVTSTPAEPQRMKGGPRHYQITFNITDSSIAPSGVTEVQVYRPYIEALPTVKEGDGILLRNFQVIAIKNRGFALRSEQNEASSWAVYKDGAAEPEVRGPPVEHGKAEYNHMVAMKEWYSSLDAASVAKLQRANADKGYGVGKGTGKAS